MPSQSAPVFRLYLLRHAKAAWTLPGKKDFDRTLDETGYADAEIVAGMAADKGFIPDLVVCSTAVRCRQTAEALRRAMGEDLEIQYIDALYAGTSAVYLELIGSQDLSLSSLMVVGHNPVIEEVFRGVLGEEAAMEAIPAGYPPGALAVIDIDEPPRDGVLLSGKLVDWLDPDHRKP